MRRRLMSLLHGQTVPTVRHGKKPESASTCPQQVLKVDPNIDCDGGSTHSAIIGLGTFGVIVYAAGWVHLHRRPSNARGESIFASPGADVGRMLGLHRAVPLQRKLGSGLVRGRGLKT